jgi:ribosome-associated translation inhibitor RaiA
MRTDVSFKRMKSSEYLENIIQKDVEKIKKRVKIFRKDEAVHLSLHIEKNPHREEYLSWATLYLPGKVLKAQQRGYETAIAMNKVTQALLRQIAKYKLILERHLKKRPDSFSEV